jgi:hypothetical protein
LLHAVYFIASFLQPITTSRLLFKKHYSKIPSGLGFYLLPLKRVSHKHAKRINVSKWIRKPETRKGWNFFLNSSCRSSSRKNTTNNFHFKDKWNRNYRIASNCFSCSYVLHIKLLKKQLQNWLLLLFACLIIHRSRSFSLSFKLRAEIFWERRNICMILIL